MNKPKVMIVGGTDVVLRLDLMHCLSSHYNLVAVGSNPTIRHRFARAGFVYHNFPMARTFNPFIDTVSVVSLFSLFRKEKPQIVHTFDTKPSILGRLAARLASVPIVIGTITGLGTLYLTDSPSINVVRTFYERAQKLISQVSDLTMFYNHDDAQHFIDRKVVQPHKVAVIPGSGVSVDRFSPDIVDGEEKAHIKRELEIAPDQIVVTMISRLVRSKGVLLFAAAAQQVKDSLPHVCFLLIGPEDSESIDGLTSQEIHSLSCNVKWIGPQPDIEKMLAISDIIALPSGREGIPRVLVEAASMGLPLVTSRVPGCSEVVKDGINGFLIEQGDIAALSTAIAKLSTDATLREKFGKASRELALSRFSLEVISNSISEIYNQLLNRSL